jgi:hypothetical protein
MPSEITLSVRRDGRGDNLIQGLKQACLLINGKIHVDVLKLPHLPNSSIANEANITAQSTKPFSINTLVAFKCLEAISRDRQFLL